MSEIDLTPAGRARLREIAELIARELPSCINGGEGGSEAHKQMYATYTAAKSDLDKSFTRCAEEARAEWVFGILSEAALDLIDRQLDVIADLRHRADWLWQDRIESSQLLGVDLGDANERLRDAIQAALAAKETIDPNYCPPPVECRNGMEDASDG